MPKLELKDKYREREKEVFLGDAFQDPLLWTPL